MASSLCALSQTALIKGVVRDSLTHAPLPNASISIRRQAGGTRTNAEGRFSIPAEKPEADLLVTIVGYNSYSIHLDSIPAEPIVIQLSQKYKELSKVTIRTKKQKYRNKGNPAVDLIRNVINNKDKNRMESYSYASYEKYEKLQVSVDKLSKKMTQNRLVKPYRFLFDNADTTTLEGRTLSPVYLEETLSQNYYRKDPEKSKSVITGKRKVDFGDFFDMQGISQYLNRLYQDFNIYDNNISVFTNLFLSPIADMGPTFYMYYIDDTVTVDSQKLIKLSFRPRNPNDLLFRGTMWITLDGNYAIQKLKLLVSKSINFNFVREMRINQDFTKRPDGRYLLTKSDVLGDFGITKNGTGLFGERTVSFRKFTIGEPISDSLMKGPPVVTTDSATSLSDSFWVAYRPDTLTRAESKVYANIDSLKNMKSFRRLMDWGTLLLAGYKQAGPFEIGPASTFYSFNPVEGFRLRFGGRTTTKLSTRFYSEVYAAYGFKDEKWKYFLSGTYSLNNKSVYGYPINFIRASYQRDTKIPGQELQFVQEDNFLLSFKRGNNDKWLYNDIFRLQYKREFGDHLSYDFGLKYWKQAPAGSIAYVQKMIGGLSDSLQSITTGEASLELRWASHEQFYIGKLYRVPIINKYPIFDLRYIAGVKGLFGGQYNYHNFDLNIYKRFYIGPLGYSDITFDGSYIIGKIPFPLADIHHANQTYAYQLASFNLMNFLEFVSDHYVSVDIDHYFNGFFFNKLPLLKKLKWREVVEAKILVGGLRSENSPDRPDQMKFPLTNGRIETFSLTNEPYIEAGFAIANIFKLVRVDFIKRFTYLNDPEIPLYGIRLRTKFDF